MYLASLVPITKQPWGCPTHAWYTGYAQETREPHRSGEGPLRRSRQRGGGQQVGRSLLPYAAVGRPVDRPRSGARSAGGATPHVARRPQSNPACSLIE